MSPVNKEYKEAARDLQGVLLLGRALAALKAEEKVDASLTHSEIITLQYIYRLSEAKIPVTASEIADVLQKDKTWVSHLLKKLEEPENRYVTRRYESTSRLLLELTERGEKITEQAIESDAKDLLAVLRLVKDENQLKIVKSLLKDIHAAMVASLREMIEERKKKGDS